MAGKARVLTVIPGRPHHLILRGNNRRNLFSYAFERRHFVQLVDRAALLSGCLFHGLSLLTNHVHALITPPGVAELSACVQRFSHAYAVFRNRRRGGSGKLFEARFVAKPITDDRYCAVVTVYVDDNPNMANLPAALRPWSTLGHHLNDPGSSAIPGTLWTPSEWYLSLGATAEARSSQYAEWLASYRAHHARERERYKLEGTTSHTRRVERPDRSSAK